jgi:hypothetical protein
MMCWLPAVAAPRGSRRVTSEYPTRRSRARQASGPRTGGACAESGRATSLVHKTFNCPTCESEIHSVVLNKKSLITTPEPGLASRSVKVAKRLARREWPGRYRSPRTTRTKCYLSAC